ncbi:MAG: peptidylprolyl isomerase [bacterium]|nr:peptidylprolyl isomerase [bacterium]
MGQKQIVIFFVLVGVVALGIAGARSFKASLGEELTPTPTPEKLVFNNNEQNKDPSQVTQNPTFKQISQPTQKMTKSYQMFPGVLPSEELKNKKAVIVTDKGIIEFAIYPEASKAASNFIFLTKDGFYDGLTFHRVVPGFVIQGGDPLGNGTGGPGYQFEDEPVTEAYNKGIVAMANAGPNTNGSQFFIMLEDNPSLPPNYTIFGKVISGQEVVDKIQVGDIMKKVTISNI